MEQILFKTIEKLGLDGTFFIILFQSFILKMMIKAEAYAIISSFKYPVVIK